MENEKFLYYQFSSLSSVFHFTNFFCFSFFFNNFSLAVKIIFDLKRCLDKLLGVGMLFYEGMREDFVMELSYGIF